VEHLVSTPWVQSSFFPWLGACQVWAFIWFVSPFLLNRGVLYRVYLSFPRDGAYSSHLLRLQYPGAWSVLPSSNFKVVLQPHFVLCLLMFSRLCPVTILSCLGAEFLRLFVGCPFYFYNPFPDFLCNSGPVGSFLLLSSSQFLSCHRGHPFFCAVRVSPFSAASGFSIRHPLSMTSIFSG